MNKLTLGLCEGRHEIPEVSEYIFGNSIDPLDFASMSKTCHNKLAECDQLDLYVTY